MPSMLPSRHVGDVAGRRRATVAFDVAGADPATLFASERCGGVAQPPCAGRRRRSRLGRRGQQQEDPAVERRPLVHVLDGQRTHRLVDRGVGAGHHPESRMIPRRSSTKRLLFTALRANPRATRGSTQASPATAERRLGPVERRTRRRARPDSRNCSPSSPRRSDHGSGDAHRSRRTGHSVSCWPSSPGSPPPRMGGAGRSAWLAGD